MSEKQILTFSLVRKFVERLDVALKQLGYDTRTEWLREKAREAIKQAEKEAKR